jgi:hypothetical protein
MKKLLLTSLTLFLFSASILMFQMSCSKDANAGNSGGSGTLGQGKILILKTNAQFAIIDMNGAESLVNITLPSQYTSIQNESYATDGNLIYFVAYAPSSSSEGIFTCDMNGNNVKLLRSTRE